jgi:SpoVK/Ycf46/Vps4 family AAA+-type ATPase
MAEQVISKREILSLIARVAALSAFSYLTMKWLVDALDPTRKQQLQAKERAKKLLKSLGVSPDIKLNNHELMVASNLVEPSSIQVSWKDIAGLESVIEELRETVILPIKVTYIDLFNIGLQKISQSPIALHQYAAPNYF